MYAKLTINEKEFTFATEEELEMYLMDETELDTEQAGWLLRDGRLDVSGSGEYRRYRLEVGSEKADSH